MILEKLDSEIDKNFRIVKSKRNSKNDIETYYNSVEEWERLNDNRDLVLIELGGLIKEGQSHKLNGVSIKISKVDNFYAFYNIKYKKVNNKTHKVKKSELVKTSYYNDDKFKTDCDSFIISRDRLNSIETILI